MVVVLEAVFEALGADSAGLLAGLLSLLVSDFAGSLGLTGTSKSDVMTYVPAILFTILSIS